MCPVGAYGDISRTACVLCVAGKIAPSMGGSTCTSCEPGRFAATSAAATCTACLPNYYQPSTQASSCHKCPPQSTSRAGQSSFEECRCGSGIMLCAAESYLRCNGTTTLHNLQRESEYSCANCPRGTHFVTACKRFGPLRFLWQVPGAMARFRWHCLDSMCQSPMA